MIADFTTHRTEIEQAKGILMTIYDISAEHAFDILVWRSQETNTKLRKLVRQIIRDFTTQLNVPSDVRERADHLLLTAHERVGSTHEIADRPAQQRVLTRRAYRTSRRSSDDAIAMPATAATTSTARSRTAFVGEPMSSPRSALTS